MRGTLIGTRISGTPSLFSPPLVFTQRSFDTSIAFWSSFIHDEAQQEAALSDLAILGALSRKCFVLRLGDSKETSGGTGSSDLACKVRL